MKEAPKTWDLAKYTLAIDRRISTGHATEGVAATEHNEDATEPYIHADGSVTYQESADNTGKLTLTYAPNSSMLPHIRNLCARKRMFNVSIVDANQSRRVAVNADGCRVIKMPPMEGNVKMSAVTVEIFIPDLNYL